MGCPLWQQAVWRHRQAAGPGNERDYTISIAAALKRAAETLNFLTEHGIGSLEELSERCDGAAAATAKVKADLRTAEKEMEWLTLTMKHAATYRQLRPLYDQYR